VVRNRHADRRDVHLDSLSGDPGATARLSAVREAAVRDAKRLVVGDGLLIENYGDAPSSLESVPNTLWQR